jgi:probable H4MPT-linked C1 transfer pathway protein
MRGMLGLDIGGARLKAAYPDGSARSLPFALWKEPRQLPAALCELVGGAPAHARIAVTMTGELCDCFESKSQGVRTIVDAVEAIAEGKAVHVWTLGGFVDVAQARAKPLAAASANWLALAAFAGRYVQGNGLLVDIGSTTTDIVPISAGRPVPKGFADPERLRSLELVYTGVRRTPLCAVLGGGVAAELFATTLDVFLVLGSIAEDATYRQTADGRPATRAAAHARLARMLCADPDSFDQQETTKLAQRALLRQVYQLTMAFDHVLRSLPRGADTVVLAGEGEFLARLVLSQQNSFRGGTVISLSEKLGFERSCAACAYAVAVLAQEML